MKVSILNNSGQHLCCLGFLFELFKEDEIDVFIVNDPERYYEYYKSIYSSSLISLKTYYNKWYYDLSININSHSTFFGRQGFVSIAHIIEHTDQYNKFITLTPWVQGENVNLFYIFPLYKGIISNTYTNIIIYLGYIIEPFVDEDTKNFIRELKDYTFIFVGGSHIEGFNNMTNVKQYSRVDQVQLVDMLNISKFVLTRKIPFQKTDRYSGTLGHSISHRKPMIIQKYTSDSYNLPGIVFNDNYCEVIHTIKNMTDEDYTKQLEAIDISCKDLSINNKDALKRLISS
jgi:hypothetical protein